MTRRNALNALAFLPWALCAAEPKTSLPLSASKPVRWKQKRGKQRMQEYYVPAVEGGYVLEYRLSITCREFCSPLDILKEWGVDFGIKDEFSSQHDPPLNGQVQVVSLNQVYSEDLVICVDGFSDTITSAQVMLVQPGQVVEFKLVAGRLAKLI